MSAFLRRIPLGRLLLVCGSALAFAIGVSALALGLGAGPTPPAQSLAQALHKALSAPAPDGISARVQFTNSLLEGASLAADNGSGGALAGSPLLTGASGRLWISRDGRVRLELQSERGDTEVTYDGHTLSIYEPSSNTIYRYTPPAHEGSSQQGSAPYAPMQDRREVPSVTKIEEALARASKHADISAATPTDIAGRPAYTVRISPREHPGLIGGAELSFDAEQGIPLRGAVYAKGASAAALELVASEISYEAVPASTFELTPAPGMQVKEIEPHKEGAASGSKGGDETQPKVSHHGLGLESIAVIESHPKPGQNPSANLPEGLQKVKINGITASELPTALGTLLTFERAGVNYVLVGSVTPEAIESLARGL